VLYYPQASLIAKEILFRQGFGFRGLPASGGAEGDQGSGFNGLLLESTFLERQR